MQQAAVEQNAEAFVIGGYVRDLMLKRLNKDIDIVTSGDGPALANRTAELLNVKRVSIFANFGTAHFVYKGSEVEFVSARKESYRATSRKPDVEKGSLEDDQMRRDFTVNAMALSLQEDSFGELVDPFNGLLDLENKILRTPLEPAITYSDDPLRMMRAVRFASQLNFTIEEKSLEAIKENAARLEIVSVERTMVEFNKILLSKKPSVGMKLLFDTELLHQFFPEMVKLHGVEKRNNNAHKDNFYHTLEVVDNLRANTNNL
ncbi:MAG: CCA tRNA nucleotidyltransferase, partial [Flavobacteriales bacterium]|nr:CCA tRNA nucleotidyltransferase [Flavobacteriales bacterium]